MNTLSFSGWPVAPASVLHTRVESGSDGPDYLGHLGHFLMGQVGVIHKLNYLDVTCIFNRSHVLLEKDIGI